MHKAVIGLGYGDEGKGTLVDFLCSEGSPLAVVRFNGGAQAAHNVILEDGTHHTFSQFGSGTLRGIHTVLSKFMMVNPVFLYNEAQALKEKTGSDPYLKLVVSENALVTTFIHVAANQCKERQRGANRHGSVGLGIGETMSYSLNHPDKAMRVKDLQNYDTMMDKLLILIEHYKNEDIDLDFPYWQQQVGELYGTAQLMNMVTDEFINNILRAGDVVFEGAQGVLLDQHYGFHPHTTWSAVTRQNLDTLITEAQAGPVEVIGATRTYQTRHGAGPMPSEFPTGTNWEDAFPEPHNGTGEFQGGWRVGYLDLPLLDYALSVCPVDTLGMTHMDISPAAVITDYPQGFFAPQNRPEQIQITELAKANTGRGIKREVSSTEEILTLVEQRTGKKVAITSYGPTAADKCRR